MISRSHGIQITESCKWTLQFIISHAQTTWSWNEIQQQHLDASSKEMHKPIGNSLWSPNRVIIVWWYASLPAQFANTDLTDQTSEIHTDRFVSSVWWIKMNTENLRHQISSSYWARVDLHLIAWARHSFMVSLVPPNCVLLGFLLKTAGLQHSTFNLLQHKHFCLPVPENVILKYLLPCELRQVGGKV